MTNYDCAAKEILEAVGGKENIEFFTHCVTRLRFNLKDRSKVSVDKIKSIKGVLGSQWSSDQLQIIIGQDVDNYYDAVCAVGGIQKEAAIDENLDPSLVKKNVKITPKTVFNTIINTISDCIFPVIPIYLGSGLILLIVNLLGPSVLNVISPDGDFATVLKWIGNAGYYFIPIFMAWSAAKHFKTSIPLAMMLCSVLIYPDLINLVNEGGSMTVYGIPMTMVSYRNQILPSILIVWVLSYVYKFVDGHMPKSLKYAFNPVCTILIMLPLVLCVLGPVGTYVGRVIADVCVWISETVGPLAIGIVSGLWYILVGLGMDKALSPVYHNNFTLYGYDNLFWLSAITATYALMGVGLAYMLRCKKEEKSAAASAFVTLAIGGVSEPTIFGCLFRYKKSMAAYIIGGFVGGVLSGLFGLKAYSFGTGNILFFTVCAQPGVSLAPAIIACSVGFAVSFVLALMFGFNDSTPKKTATK